MIHPDRIRKQRLILIGLLVWIAAAAAVSAGVGYSSLSFNRLLPTLIGQGTFKEEFVLFSVRLPRIVIVLLTGMALAVSGAILQAITRNDLADPGIVGINAGAGVAVAVFFLYFPIGAGTFIYFLPAAALIGALAAAGIIYVFSIRRFSALQPVRMVLTGVGVSMALSGAMIVLISSAEREKVDFISQWLAGDIWGDDWPFIAALLPWLLVLLPLALYKANRLNLLALSDAVSAGVGVAVHKERTLLLLTAVALAASAVSVAGSISFVGLMAPHMAKRLVGPRNQLSLPVAICIGGLLMLIADTIGRNIVEPDGVSTGIIVALIGAPYFIYLLVKK